MDPQDDEEEDVPVQRFITRQRRASHPPTRDLFAAHREEMNRAFDAFQRRQAHREEEMNRAFDAFQRDIWADPLTGRSSRDAQQRTQRRLSTPNDLFFHPFLDTGPLFRTAFEAPRLSVPPNMRNIHIDWLDDIYPPALHRPHDALSSSPPRIEDVSSSSDPQVLNVAPQQHVCVVELPSAPDTDKTPDSHINTGQSNSFNPNAPVIIHVSTDIHDE